MCHFCRSLAKTEKKRTKITALLYPIYDTLVPLYYCRAFTLKYKAPCGDRLGAILIKLN